MKTKVMKDGFVWLIINNKKDVEAIYKYTTISIYVLYEDGSESMIERKKDLEEALVDGAVFGIEVGYIADLVKQQKEG